MGTTSEGWTIGPYSREEGEAPTDVWPSESLVGNLRAALDGRDDEQKVTISAGTLRSLLAAVEHEGLTHAPGASIRDPRRGATFNVTTSGSEGRVWLRSVEVVLDDPNQQPDPSLWRLPAQRLADAAALYAAQNAGRASESRGAGPVVVTDEHGNVVIEVADTRPGPPDTDELAALVKAGENRRTLAARFGRSVTTVDGWLGRARIERPDLFPPQRRGPRPGGSA